MRLQLLGIKRISILGVALLLAACSGNGLQPVSATANLSSPQSKVGGELRKIPSWMKFADSTTKRNKSALFEPYVATLNTNENSGSFAAQYTNHDPRGNQVCALPGPDTDYIGGVATDQSGDLYVPQSVGAGTNITAYAPHCGDSLTTLTNSVGNQPQDVAVDGNTVYEIDGSYRDPEVEVFANGATSPTGTLTDPSIYQSISLAVDSSHDVFLSYYNSTAGTYSVIEFPAGAMPGSVLPMTGGDGLLVDNSNNLLYVTPNGSVWQVDSYAPPYTGSPTQSITIKGIPGRGSAPYCALTHRATLLFCGDGLYESLDAYKYPSGVYIYSLLLPYSPYSLTYSIANAPSP